MLCINSLITLKINQILTGATNCSRHPEEKVNNLTQVISNVRKIPPVLLGWDAYVGPVE